MNKKLRLIVAEALLYSKGKILKKKDQFNLTVNICNQKGIRAPSYSTFLRVRTSILEESFENNLELESIIDNLKEPEGSDK